jgi:hypothetical protein
MNFRIHSLLILLILTSTSVFAQLKTITPGSSFTKVKVSTGLFVEIKTGADESKIEVKGTERNKVNVELKDDELQLNLPIGQVFSEAEILVTVFTKEIEELKARSGSEVEFISEVKQDQLSLIASEGSYIGGKLQVKNLEVRAVTGASISLIGEASTSTAEVKTGGTFDGENLATTTTGVKVSFGGEALVSASKTCSASVKGGGNISIYGNPKTLSQNVKLGGNIRVIE